MKRKLWKKVLNLILAFAMVVGMISGNTLTAFAADVPEKLVSSLAQLYEGDEQRARADLEALNATGLISEGGKLVDLDIRENGKSTELAALAERIAKGETVGEITVNGNAATAEQITKIQQVSAALEVAKLMDEEIDVTDEHVENLKSLLTGIQDGDVNLENALKTGELSLGATDEQSLKATDEQSLKAMDKLSMKSASRPALMAAGEELPETISKSTLSEDYRLPDTALDDLHLLNLNSNGTGYFGPYSGSNGFDSNHEFTFQDPALANKEYYYIDSRFRGSIPSDDSSYWSKNYTEANGKLVHKDTDGCNQYIDWDNVKWGVSQEDSGMMMTIVMPLFQNDTTYNWVANFAAYDCTTNGIGIELPLPEPYGKKTVTEYMPNMYFSSSSKNNGDMDAQYMDIARIRYPAFIVTDNNDKPIAFATCFAVEPNPSTLVRKDTIYICIDTTGRTTFDTWGFNGRPASYVEPPYIPPFEPASNGWNDQYYGGAASLRKTDALGFPYFEVWQTNGDPRDYYTPMAPRFADFDLPYYVPPMELLDQTKFIERTAAYETVGGGFIKLTNPDKADFPYLYPGDPEHPENQYDIELLATEDLYQILTGDGIIYGEKDYDLRFTWQFSNRKLFSDKEVDVSSYSNNFLKFEQNDEKVVVLTPTSGTETRLPIGAKVKNGGVTPYDVSFPTQVVVRNGKEPYLMIPRSSRTRETLTDVGTDVFFASNITQQNQKATVFSAKLYQITEEMIGQEIPEGTEPVSVENWGEFPSTTGEPVTSIPVPGTALAKAGAYAVTISTECNDGAKTMSFSATAYLKVKNAPAKISFHKLNSYSVVKGQIPEIKYTVDSKADQVEVKYTVQPAGGEVSEMTAVSDGTIPFDPGTIEGTKKAYIITVYARNSEEDPWSTDSMLLTVYNDNPIKLVVKNVPVGKVGGSTGGVAPDEPVKSITLDNSETVQQLIEKLGEAGYTFEDFRADVNLQELISANYGSGTLGILTDKLQWSATENGEASDALTLNYAENGAYNDIRNDSYTYYIPTADFLMVGTDNKTVTVTATHALTGLESSVDVTVKSLKDKLYLFRFSPKTTVKLSYTSGKGDSKEATTNEQGELVLYEPDGIDSDVLAMATFDGETYVGTIVKNSLTSGEKDISRLELYPCNYLSLRPISSQTLTFLTPDGRPYNGKVTLRGGVYANGRYCPNAGIRTTKDDNTQYLREDAEVTVTNGKATVWFDPTQFTSMNSLRYVFEYRFENSYQPGYVMIDPASKDPADSIINLRAISGGAAAPQIIRQEYQQYHNGNTPTAYQRNVVDSKDNIGISRNYPKAALYSVIAFPGESVSEGEKVESNKGYSVYENKNAIKFALYTSDGKTKLTGQTDPEESVKAAQITDLSQLNNAGYFVFPFSSMPMLRSTYTMTDENLKADGITDEGEKPTATSRIKAVMTRDKMTIASLNMPFGVSNLSHQKDMSTDANSIGTEIRGNLRKNTDIGEIFRSINVNDMIRKGFVFLGNLSGLGGNNLINLMILPTQDPATFRIIAFVGANQRSDDDDDGVSVNFNSQDLAEDMNNFKKEMEELNNKKDDEKDSGGSGSLQFNFYGTVILEARIGVGDGNWDISFRGGNVGTNVKGKYGWGQNFFCGPYPAFINFETGFHADLEVAFGNKDAARAMLLDAALGVSIEAFAGLGFDLSIVALQLGIYGKIGADVNFLLLNSSDTNMGTKNGTKLTIAGEIGLKLKVKVLFISYTKNFASTGFNWTKKWGNYDQIKNYWTSQGYGLLMGKTTSGRAYSMYLFEDGSTMVAIEGEGELENRDYLDLSERAWKSGKTGLLRLFSAGSMTDAIQDIQTNSYPHSHPAFTDDGEMFLYVSDNDNAEKVESVVSYAEKNEGGYADKGRVDTSEDNVLADLDVVASGTKENAFAAWVKQIETPQRASKNAVVTNDELGMMFNATEIYAGSYSDGTWKTERLTENSVADMAPTVASNGSKAVVAWRSMNASSMPADGADAQDITAMFDVENNINYRIYNGSEWTEAKVVYNGNMGTVNAIDSAMLPDGTAILTYTVRTGEDTASTETFYTVIGADGNALTNGRLTNDSYTDSNAQVTVVNDASGGYFVLGWYSEHEAGEGNTFEYDEEGKATEKAVVAHDIRLARINANGSYDMNFPESIGGTGEAGISPDFHFSAPVNNTELTNVSVVWSQRKDSDAAEDAGKYQLNAVRFFNEDGTIGVTAPTDIAETAKNYTIDRFDTYTDGAGAIHAIILGTDYDSIEGIGVYDSIDLNAAAGETVYSNSDSPNNLKILDGEAISSLKLATGTFPETAADVTADVNINEVIPGFTTPVQFTVTNTGTSKINSVTAIVGEQSKDFNELNLLPNQSASLLMNYSVPESVSDAAYTVKSGDTELGSGTLTLNRPDVGISGMKLLQEYDGKRDIQVTLSNGSEIPLAGSGKTVKLAFYKDAFHMSRIGEEISISGDDLADIDADRYTTVQTLNVTDIARLVDGEIPEEGLTVYAHAWVEDTEEPNVYNNDNYVSFKGLLARNNGEKLTTDTSLKVNTDEQDNVTGYTVYVNYRNNSMQEQKFNVPVAVLIAENGEIIAHKNLQDTDLDLTMEQQRELSATFTAEDVGGKIPASVEIDYLYEVSFDLNGGTGEFDPILTDHLGHIVVPEAKPEPPENEDPLFFRGWYTSKTGGELITNKYRFTENSTIYARYTPHEHVFSYKTDKTNADDDTVIATCVSTVEDVCPLENQERTVTMTIVKPERAGQEAGNPNATIVGATDVLGTPEIRYYKANDAGTDKTGEALSSVPVDKGKYWAEFTFGEGEGSATAHVVYDLIVDDVTDTDKTSLSTTYTVNYNLNGGTGQTPEGGTFYYKVKLTLPGDEGISRPNLVFDGWNTKSDGTGDAYAPGDTYTVTGNTIFYAQWKHVHQWSLAYNEENHTFTQTCGVPGCTLGNGKLTLRVEAADKVYDGENVQPYTCSDGWNEDNGFELPTITYYSGGEEVSEAKNVGTYTARVSLYDKQINVGECHVTKRPVAIIADDKEKHDGGDDPDFTVSCESVGEKLYFENDAAYPWQVVTEGDRVYVRSGNGGVGRSTSTLTLKVELAEAGTLSFDYKYGTEKTFDKAYFKVDNTEMFSVSNVGNWRSYSCALSAGAHTLTWYYSKDSGGDDNGDFFAVDDVVISTEGDVTQADASDSTVPFDSLNADLRFLNDANYPWTETTEGDRVYAKSGNSGIGDSRSTLKLYVTLEKAGTVSFDYNYGSEGGFDCCYFDVDNGEKLKVSGAGKWESASFELPAGSHTLTWYYKKDGSTDNNGDFFAVDNIVFTTEGAVTQEDPNLVLIRALNKFEGGLVEGETLNYTVSYEEYEEPDEYPITVPLTVTPGENPNYDVSTVSGTLTVLEPEGEKQTITAEDVTVTYGDTDKSVNGSVTDPATGGGAISYAVKSGSEDYIDVNASTGVLTIKKVPADGKAYVNVKAKRTDTYSSASKTVTVTINPKAMTVIANDKTAGINGRPHGITVTAADPETGYTVKYGKAEGTYDLDTSPTWTDEEGEHTVYYQVTAENYSTYTGSAILTLVHHDHEMSYAGGKRADTIIATCSSTTCYLEDNTATLTIGAPTLTKYGQTGEGISAEATITDEDGIQGDATVRYFKANNDNTKGEELTKAPTDAGKYRAEITLGTGGNTATAHVIYTIAKADPIAEVPSAAATYGQTLADVALANPEGNTDGTWAWTADAATSVGNAGENTFKAVFTPADTTNYNSRKDVDVTVKVARAKATAEMKAAAAILQVKNGQTATVSYVLPEGANYGDVDNSAENEEIFTVNTSDGLLLTAAKDMPETDPQIGQTKTFTVQISGATNYEDYTLTVAVTLSYKMVQTIAADDVTAIYGDTDKSVTGSVTEPATDGGTISYAVKSGSEAYIDVDASTGALTIKKVPADGKAYIIVTASETNDYAQATRVVTVKINKADSSVTAEPDAEGLTYNAQAQKLVKAGEAAGGTMVYAVTDSEEAPEADAYSDALPEKTDAKTYYVWYKVAGDSNHNDTEPGCKTVKIAPADPEIPGGLTATYGDTLESVSLPADWAWADSEESVGNAGTNSFKANYTAPNKNYNSMSDVDISVKVNKADSSVTTAPVAEDLTYNTRVQKLVKAGEAAGGTMVYAVTDSEEAPEADAYSDALPEKTDAKTYYVWYKVAGDSNHKDTAPEKLSVQIAKQSVEAPAIAGKAYTGESQTADVEASDLYTVKTNNGGTDVGGYDVVLELKDASNYKWPESDKAERTLEFRITKAEENKVTVNIEGWTYGDDAKIPVAESDFGTPVFTYSNEEAGNYTSEVPVHAGTWYVKAEVEGTDNYAGGSAVKSFAIAKKTLNIKADAKSRIYGEDDPALTYTSEGLVGSDAITGTLERAEGDNAGTYEIMQGTVAASDDYAINYSSALFTINKADSDTTSPEANELTYNGAEQELVKAGNPTGGTLVYSLDGENYAAAIPVARDAGQYTVSYKVAGDGNHNDTEPAQITVTILKKDLMVTAKDQNKIYGADDPELTYTFEGLEDGDSFAGALSREEGDDVGTYPINIGSLSAGSNYNILFTRASLTIEKADSVVTAAPSAKTDLIYSGKAQELITAGTSEGGEMLYALGTDAAGEPDTEAYTASIPTATEAGTYNVWYSVAGDFNHNDTAPESLEVTIAKQDVAAPDVNSKEYNSAKQTADVKATDTYTVKTNNGGTKAGEYDVVLELKDASNYKWSDSNDKAKTLKFSITKAAVNKVDLNIRGWTYGSAAKNPSAKADFGTPVITYSNAEKGTYTAKVPVNAGTWYVKADVKETADYAGGSAVKSFVIAKKALTVTAKAKSKKYGKPDPKLTYSVKGLVKGDKIKGSLKRKSGEKPGVYKINKGSLNAGSNYTMTFKNADFKIKAVSLISPLKLRTAKVTENSIKLKWSKVKGAVKYIVYGARCGTKDKYAELKTTKANTFTVKSIKNLKLKKAKSYRFRVKALDKNGMVIAKSVDVHAVTNGGKRANTNSVKLITPANGEKTLKVGASLKIKAKAILPSGKIAVHKKGLRFESSNPKIAKVSKKGKVTGKKAGSCKIFVYALNGRLATVKITVK